MPPYHVVMPAHGSHSTMPTNSRESSRVRDNSTTKAPGEMTKSRVASPAPDHSPQLMLTEPCDGPFRRAKDEWKDPFWFGIDDSGRLLDIPASFASRHTIQKWIIWLWMFPSLIYLWTSHPSGAWFLGTLDHWALLLSVVYASMSLVNAHVQPTQPAVASAGVNTYIKCFWVIFEVAAHLQALTTFLFWTITVHLQDEGYTFDYGTFVLHGAAALAVWGDGMILNRIPVRIKHYFICLGVDSFFVIWTIIHAAAGWGNGKEDPETTADQAGQLAPEEASNSIYVALDWEDETVQTIFVAMLVLLVIAPILFIFQWSLSLYSCPWTWNGSKSRNCIDFDHSRSTHYRAGEEGEGDLSPPKKRKSNKTWANANNSETSHTSSRQGGANTPTPVRESARSPTPRQSTKSPTPRQSTRSPTPNRKISTARPSTHSNTENGKGNWWERSTPKPPPPRASTPSGEKRKKKRTSSVPSNKSKREGRPKPPRDPSTMDIA